MGQKRRLVCSIMTGLCVLTAGAAARADAVVDGNEAAAAFAAQVVPSVYGRPADPHLRACTALAIFEAVNAVERRYASYLGAPVAAPPGASAVAAAASATHAVLSAYSTGRLAQLDQALAVQLSAVAEPAARTSGLAVGREAARQAMVRCAQPETGAPAYRPAATPGVYVPTELPVLSMSAYVAKPWFLRTPGEAGPPAPPPSLASSAYGRAWDEVRRLGAKDSPERTPDQTAAASFFASHDWGVLLRPLLSVDGRSLAQNARLYALAAMAADDAFTAVTVAKFDAAFWRPITAIRNADADGADATWRDPSWEPLLPTPAHPEFPCGHCIMAATIAAVLASEFGDAPRGGLTLSNPAVPGAAFRFDRFTDYAQAVANSRIYAGAHFRFSNEAAQAMGLRIARIAVERGPR